MAPGSFNQPESRSRARRKRPRATTSSDGGSSAKEEGSVSSGAKEEASIAKDEAATHSAVPKATSPRTVPLSAESLDDDEVTDRLKALLEKGPRSASELISEMLPRCSTGSRVSAMLETIESTLELAANVEQRDMLATSPFRDVTLPAWVDTYTYAVPGRERVHADALAPVPEKSPYGLLLAKHKKEFEELDSKAS